MKTLRFIYFLWFLSFILAKDLKGQAKFRTSEEIWAMNDDIFKLDSSGTLWKDEHAIILSSYYEILPIRERKGGIFSEYTSTEFSVLFRRRILIKDKVAAEAYSEFYFFDNNYRRGPFGNPLLQQAGLRIKKKSGKHVNIDLKQNAVSAEAFSSIKKIAIPGLEAGDIIDCYYYALSGSNFLQNKKIDLNESSPVLKAVAKITLPGDKTFLYLPLNCNARYSSVNLADGKICHMFEVDSLAAVKSREFWGPESEKIPSIAFDYIKETGKQRDPYIGKTGIERSLVVESASKLNAANDWHEINVFQLYNKRKDKDKYADLRDFYFLMRNPALRDNYIRKPVRTTNIAFNVNALGSSNYDLTNEEWTFTFFNWYFKDRKINYNLFFTYPLKQGKVLENPFSEEELVPLFQFGTNTDKRILYPPKRFSIPFEPDEEYDGVDGFVWELSHPKEEIKYVDSIKAKKVSEVDNSFVSEITAKLDITKHSLIIDRSCILSGQSKLPYQEAAYTDYDYNQEYLREFPTLKEDEYIGDFFSYTLKLDKKSKDIQYGLRAKRFKKLAEEEFGGSISDYNFDMLVEYGMWNNHPQMKFEESYTLNASLVEASSFIFIELGKILRRQPVLSQDTIRNSEIFLPAGTSQSYVISIVCPAGYDAGDVSYLNYDYVNEIGSISSKATVVAGEVKLEIKILPVSNRFRKDQWVKVQAFFNSALHMNYRKLALKRI